MLNIKPEVYTGGAYIAPFFRFCSLFALGRQMFKHANEIYWKHLLEKIRPLKTNDLTLSSPYTDNAVYISGS